MKTLKTAMLVLLFSAGGCEQQLVEFLDMSVSDLSVRDDSVRDDLAGRDLAGLDLSASQDLAAPDLSASTQDLALADLRTLGDGATGDGPLASPQVISTNPAGGSASFCVPFEISATFDRAMDPLTINKLTFTLSGLGMPVDGAVSYDELKRTATFAPSSALLAGTTYTATITVGAKDLFGVPLSSEHMWMFTTSLMPCMRPVNLRSLDNFVAVAGAGLTNTNTAGITTLNGDVGLSPTATCLGDGVPCSAIDPTINGTLYANDPAGKASDAKADLVSAFNDAMGRPPGTLEADLSGFILPPGVYTSGSTMMIATSGVLTLDANFDQNAVWIFQIGSSLTVNANAEVKLVNGAKAANVFWACGASSTILANVKMKGTVLAKTSNSVEVGSTVDGRLLCSDGQITLKSDTINLP